jgi:putative tricarboxylic transport membrane protein
MREVISGIALMAGGAVYAFSAFASLPLGTLRQAGPGMFPIGLGGLLFLIGVGVFVPSLFRSENLPSFGLRPLIAVLAAVAAFALLIGPFGLFPAILVSTVLSSLATPGFRPLSVLLLSIGLMVVAWVIFILILNLPMPLLQWEL